MIVVLLQRAATFRIGTVRAILPGAAEHTAADLPQQQNLIRSNQPL
jgi:hypothetical protein